MLSRAHRLTRKEVDIVLQQGRSMRSTSCSMRSLPSLSTKVAVSVSKKLAKTAVVRNRLRRAVFAACATHPYFKDIKHHIVFTVQSINADDTAKDILRNLSLLTK